MPRRLPFAALSRIGGAAFLCLLLAACGLAPVDYDRGRILAVGDSVMARNRGQGGAIPDVVARDLGRLVVDASVPGARLLPSAGATLIGLSIPAQFRARPWDWVIANGGANDLSSACGCVRCDAALDALVTQDGRAGAWPDFVTRMQAGGARRVLILGYYGNIDGGGGSFAGCEAELAELGRRLARLAATTPGVSFVTAREVIDGSPTLYAADKAHPSAEGSARIGSLVARTIAAAERR